MKAHLRLENREATTTVPEVIALSGPQVTIGRSRQQADVVLDLPPPAPQYVISRKHALLRFDGESWRLSDLGSVNGLAVNEAVLPSTGAELTLSHGDLVIIGGGTKNWRGGERVVYRFEVLEQGETQEEVVVVLDNNGNHQEEVLDNGNHQREQPEEEPLRKKAKVNGTNGDADGAAADRAADRAAAERASLELSFATERRRADVAETALRALFERLTRPDDAALLDAVCAAQPGSVAELIGQARLAARGEDDDSSSEAGEPPPAPPAARDDDDDDDDDDEDEDDDPGAGHAALCDGCNEPGHTHENCPYRSENSAAEDDDDDDDDKEPLRYVP